MSDMDTGGVDSRTRAALDLAGTQVWGVEPGRIPGVLFAALEAASGAVDRALLGAALARCWVYAGERARAVPFAVKALRDAEETGDSAVLADALDAALLTHWGPDELEVRIDLAGRLADVSAHLPDPDARLTTHLWLLTVAAETLDLSGLNRQVRALERLGEESRKARFFAATRRLMLDLMRGRTDTMAALLAIAEDTVDELPDGQLVLSAQLAYGGVQAGGVGEDVLARIRAAEEMAQREGIRTVSAELAWIHLGLGHLEDARRLAATFDAGVLARLPGDHDHLLVLHLLLDVALGTGLDDLVEAITPRLAPYAGRAVINSGAVMFHGVTDDTLCRGYERIGELERAHALREKALATYRRIGATWWRERLEAAGPPVASWRPTSTMILRPGPAGVWLVGHAGEETAVPARRGFEHLHELLSHPGMEITALRLAGGPVTVEQAGLGEVADAQALAAYRRRLARIDEELDEADAAGDDEAGERLASERTALLAEVSAATGLGGRPRIAGSGAERARVSVRKAIAAALQAIHGVDPVVARHLDSRVRTGLRCCYEPDPDAPMTWLL